MVVSNFVAKSRAAAGSREDFLRVRESAAPKYNELRGVGASAFSITSGRETSRFDEGRTDSCPTA